MLSLKLLDERSSPSFRNVFGDLLSRSRSVDTAILRIRLGAVDLTGVELARLRRFRVLVAEVNARTVEEEAYALSVDPTKRDNLLQVLSLLRDQRMEIRSTPLGGWSPDFTVFFGDRGPETLLLGLHWFRRPFPHRGPAWAVQLGSGEARRAHLRFHDLWKRSHDIGPAIRRLMERTTMRQDQDGPWRESARPSRHLAGEPKPGPSDEGRPLAAETPEVVSADSLPTPKTPAEQGRDPSGARGHPVDTPPTPG